MTEVYVTPWVVENGKKRPFAGLSYNSRDQLWHDSLTLPNGATHWGVVPADLGCVVIDIDNGDPTALLRAIDYPPATRSVSGKTHAWVLYSGEEFSKANFEAHGCSGELLHAGSGSVEPDWPYPLEALPRMRDHTATIDEWRADPVDIKSRNQQLHKDLIAAEPDSDDWYNAIDKASKAGLPMREIQQTTRSVEKYREKHPWEAPKPAQYDFMAGDYGHTAKAFAEWLRLHTQPVLFECGGRWYTRRGDCWLTDHKHIGRASAVIDDWIVELVDAEALPAIATLDNKDPRKWISSQATKRQILSSLSTRDDFERQPEELNLPPAVGLPSGAIVDGDSRSIVTKLLPADPDGDCPGFVSMIARVIDDEESVRWFRAWLRVALAGLSEAQSIVLYGPGGTGKSYLVEQVARVFGEYSRALQSQTLFVKTPAVHEAWKLAFYETRLVYDSDVRNAYWGSTDWLKLTAGDKLSTSRKGGQPFEFKPSAGLLIASNEPPVLLDSAQQRRVVPIACSNPLTSEDGSIDRMQLVRLNAQLVDELPGSVKWLLDLSLEDAMAETSKMPAKIVALKQRLLDEGDPLGGWLRTNKRKGAKTLLSDLLERMQLENVIEYDWNTRKLGAALRRRGWVVDQGSGGKTYAFDIALPDAVEQKDGQLSI